MNDFGVAVNGTELRRPQVLSPDEISILARYNSERERGHQFTPEWREQMDQLQLRFDWLGYETDDGAIRPGHRACPPIRRVNLR